MKGLYQIAMLDKLVIKAPIRVAPFVTETGNVPEWSLNGALNNHGRSFQNSNLNQAILALHQTAGSVAVLQKFDKY